MTTIRQIARLLHPYRSADGLFVRGHEVYLVPITHVVRGFSIYRTGEAERFDIATFVGTSFESTLMSPRAFSKIYRYEDWLPRWTEQNLQHRFERIIREYIIPMLRCVELSAFLPRPDPRWQGPEVSFADAFHMAHMKAPLYAAFGDFDAAIQQFDLLAQIPRGHRVMEPVLKALLDEMQPLVRSGDRCSVARQLRMWEADAIKRWGLLDNWRPTPFPLELECAPHELRRRST